jgi:hypothetical protein
MQGLSCSRIPRLRDGPMRRPVWEHRPERRLTGRSDRLRLGNERHRRGGVRLQREEGGKNVSAANCGSADRIPGVEMIMIPL